MFRTESGRRKMLERYMSVVGSIRLEDQKKNIATNEHMYSWALSPLTTHSDMTDNHIYRTIRNRTKGWSVQYYLWHRTNIFSNIHHIWVWIVLAVVKNIGYRIKLKSAKFLSDWSTRYLISLFSPILERDDIGKIRYQNEKLNIGYRISLL